MKITKKSVHPYLQTYCTCVYVSWSKITFTHFILKENITYIDAELKFCQRSDPTLFITSASSITAAIFLKFWIFYRYTVYQFHGLELHTYTHTCIQLCSTNIELVISTLT